MDPCGLWVGGIIRLYFFMDRAAVRRLQFLPKIKNLDLTDIWFQEDGATCNTIREAVAQFRYEFSEQFISRLGTINWPRRLFDLTHFEYFLWDYVKDQS